MGRPITNRYDMKTLLDHATKGADPNACWLWHGYKQTMGYGQIEVGGKLWLAHRFSFLLHHQRKPVGILLHSCDTPACVNPDHLREGTHKENTADAIERGRFDPMAVSRHSRKPRRRKLTDDQVREIRNGPGDLVDYQIRFGIAQSTAWMIRHRKSKTQVPD